MSSLSYGTSIQNEVSRLLVGADYSDLQTFQKGLIDGSSSSSPPTDGVALDAWHSVNAWAQWFAMSGSTAAPATWRRWLVARMVLLAGQQMKPDFVPMYEKRDAQAMRECIDSFARKEITYDLAADTEAWATTVQNVRYGVMKALVSRTPPVFVAVETIDANMRKVLNKTWNKANWNFRTRQCTVTISDAGAVTFSGLGAGESFKDFATRCMYYNDSTGALVPLRWASNDDIAAGKANTTAGASEGRPEIFTFENNAGTLTFHFYPFPDQEYTLNAAVFVQGPGTPSSTSSTTVWAKFPAEFHPFLEALTLAETLFSISQGGEAQALLRRTEAELEDLLPKFAEPGKPDDNPQIRDVYGDRCAMGRRWGMGWSNGEYGGVL